MDVTLQKMSNFLIVLILATSTISCAQKIATCNKETLFKQDQKDVPPNVCIPPNYVISFVYTRSQKIDFNRDGYIDYVFAIDKKSKSIGDSSYLVFYKMNTDSSYQFTKKFGNVFPVYFDPNVEFPTLKDQRLQSIFDCYVVPNPLDLLEIENDAIMITRRLDGHDLERLKYVYQYNSSLNDWQMVGKKKIYGNYIRKS